VNRYTFSQNAIRQGYGKKETLLAMEEYRADGGVFTDDIFRPKVELSQKTKLEPLAQKFADAHPEIFNQIKSQRDAFGYIRGKNPELVNAPDEILASLVNDSMGSKNPDYAAFNEKQKQAHAEMAEGSGKSNQERLVEMLTEQVEKKKARLDRADPRARPSIQRGLVRAEIDLEGAEKGWADLSTLPDVVDGVLHERSPSEYERFRKFKARPEGPIQVGELLSFGISAKDKIMRADAFAEKALAGEVGDLNFFGKPISGSASSMERARMASYRNSFHQELAGKFLDGDFGGADKLHREFAKVMAATGNAFDHNGKSMFHPENAWNSLMDMAPYILESTVAGLGTYGVGTFVYLQQEAAGHMIAALLDDVDIRSLRPDQLRDINSAAQGLAVPYAGVSFVVSRIPGLKLGTSIDKYIAKALIKDVLKSNVGGRRLAYGGIRYAFNVAFETGEEGIQGGLDEMAGQALGVLADGDYEERSDLESVLNQIRIIQNSDWEAVGKATVEGAWEALPVILLVGGIGSVPAHFELRKDIRNFKGNLDVLNLNGYYTPEKAAELAELALISKKGSKAAREAIAIEGYVESGVPRNKAVKLAEALTGATTEVQRREVSININFEVIMASITGSLYRAEARKKDTKLNERVRKLAEARFYEKDTEANTIAIQALLKNEFIVDRQKKYEEWGLDKGRSLEVAQQVADAKDETEVIGILSDLQEELLNQTKKWWDEGVSPFSSTDFLTMEDLIGSEAQSDLDNPVLPGSVSIRSRYTDKQIAERFVGAPEGLYETFLKALGGDQEALDEYNKYLEGKRGSDFESWLDRIGVRPMGGKDTPSVSSERAEEIRDEVEAGEYDDLVAKIMDETGVDEGRAKEILISDMTTKTNAVSVYDERVRDKVNAQIERTKKSLSEILPDLEFVVHETDEAFVSATGKKGHHALLDLEDGKIHINLGVLTYNKLMDEDILAHEGFHAMITKVIAGHPEVQARLAEIFESIAPKLTGDLKTEIDGILDRYKGEDYIDEEGVAFIFGKLANDYNLLGVEEKSAIQKLIEYIKNLFGIETKASDLEMLRYLAMKAGEGEIITQADMMFLRPDFRGVSYKELQEEARDLGIKDAGSRGKLEARIEDEILRTRGSKFIQDKPEFKERFAGSKAVDERGDPIMLFHGTAVSFTEFDPLRGDGGTHLGSEGQANEIVLDAASEGRRVYPFYLAIKNPLHLVDHSSWSKRYLFPQLKKIGIKEHDILDEEYYDLYNKLDDTKTEKEYEAVSLEIHRYINQKTHDAIRKKGYDGISYINRYEVAGVESVAIRLKDQKVKKIRTELSDEAFLKAVPEAEMSYIAFEKEQLIPAYSLPTFGNVRASKVSEFYNAERKAQREALEEIAKREGIEVMDALNKYAPEIRAIMIKTEAEFDRAPTSDEIVEALGIEVAEPVMESAIAGVPDPSNAQKTQVATTTQSYVKSEAILNGLVSGKTLDFGAGLGKGSEVIGADSYEPFPKGGFKPDFTKSTDIPDGSYEKVISPSVLNVVPRDIRDGIVTEIGRVLKEGGHAVITTRTLADVSGAKFKKAHPSEEGAFIVGKDKDKATYQKGFTSRELQSYLKDTLGDGFDVVALPKTPDGKTVNGATALIKKGVRADAKAPLRELPDGSLVKGHGYRAARQSHTDLFSGLTKSLFSDQELFAKLAKDFIITDSKLSDFAGEKVILHQPDSMFVGDIMDALTGNKIIEGKGGMYFTMQRHEEGELWASTKKAMIPFANLINKAYDENNGRVLIMLTTAPQNKMLSSTTAANGVIDLLGWMAGSKKFELGKREVDAILKAAAVSLKEEIPGNVTKKGKQISTPYVTDGKTFKEIKSYILTRLGATESTFGERKAFVLDMLGQLVIMGKERPELGGALQEFFGDAASGELFAKVGGKFKLSLANVKNFGIPGLFGEPSLSPSEMKSDRNSGDVYAVLEINSKVDAIDSDHHESYPAALKIREEGVRTKLHILEKVEYWQDNVLDPVLGTQFDVSTDTAIRNEIEEKQEVALKEAGRLTSKEKNELLQRVSDEVTAVTGKTDKMLYPSSGVSQILTISPKPKGVRGSRAFPVEPKLSDELRAEIRARRDAVANLRKDSEEDGEFVEGTRSTAITKKALIRTREAYFGDDLDEIDKVKAETDIETARKKYTFGGAEVLTRNIIGARHPMALNPHQLWALAFYKSSVEERINNIDDKIEEQGALDFLLKERAVELQRLEDALNALRIVGNQWGRAGVAIRMSQRNIDEYGVPNLTNRAMLNKGDDLSPDERETLNNSARNIRILDKKIDKMEAALLIQDKKFATTEADRFIKEYSTGHFDRDTLKAEREEILGRIKAIVYKKVPAKRVRASRIADGADQAALNKEVAELAINFIRSGVRNLPDLVTAIRTEVQTLSERDIHNILGGRTKKAEKRAIEEARQVLVELKKQARLESQIADALQGVFDPKKELKPDSPEVADLRKKLKELRDSAHEISDDEKADAIYAKITLVLSGVEEVSSGRPNAKQKSERLLKAERDLHEVRMLMRVNSEIKELERIQREHDWGAIKKSKPRVEVSNKELVLAREKRYQHQAHINNMIYNLREKTNQEKFANIMGVPRAIQATADMSYALRQGLTVSAGHPFLASKAFITAVRAAFDPRYARRIDMDLREHPNHQRRIHYGLYLSSMDAPLDEKEESFATNLLDKVWGVGHIVRASERNMVTGLNMLRTSLFDKFDEDHPDASPEALEAYARYITIATGRGDLGSFKGAANALSVTFFSARFMASRVEAPIIAARILIGAKEGKHTQHELRGEIARQWLAMLGTGSAVLVLAGLAGAEVGDDPEDSDWGKIVIGNVRFDIWGGLLSPMRVLAVAIKKLHPDHRDADLVGVGLRFLQYKLAPPFSLTHGLLYKRDWVRRSKEVDRVDVMLNAFTPLITQTAIDAWKSEYEALEIAVIVGAEFVGVGSTVRR